MFFHSKIWFLYGVIECLGEVFIFIFLAYGKVFLVRKNSGHDVGQLYAMKVRLLVLFSKYFPGLGI